MKSLVKKKTLLYKFSQKHIEYIRKTEISTFNIAEGAVRAGKTVDNIYAFYNYLKTTRDKIHLASGSTQSTAKTIIGDSNGLGLEYLFRGQCHWGKFKGNEALIIKGPATKNRTRVIVFVGGAKADSYKKFRGFSIGGWIATEINLHHINTVREAFNRTAAAKDRKFFWDLNPDHPKHFIYLDFIDKYIRLQEEGKLKGVNYQHFTIDDNSTLPKDRIDEIKAQYDPTSIWYLKDIEGRRVIAEGLIYNILVNSLTANKLNVEIDFVPNNLQHRIIGIDFGGNKSGHAFTCAGITRGYEELIALKSHKMDAKDTDPDKLFEAIYQFTIACIQMFGTVDVLYCDSAEQVLINGIRTYFNKKALHVRVENALKMPINERINTMNVLTATNRFKYFKGQCDSLIEALCSAIWNPDNKTENERLDNGTSDIDTLDSWEYTFERYAALLIRR